jgi:hypothetical protein
MESTPLQLSQHSSFRDYDKEEWYQSYIMGIKKPSNRRMDFGSQVGKRIETDHEYIPQLPRGIMEHGINVFMDDIELTGFMDSYIPEERHIHEFKTSSPAGWTQEKVDNHHQLTFYCLLLLLKENISPEDVKITLHHMVTEESGDFSIKFATPFTLNSYTTKRTTKDCLMFGAEIIKQRKEMEEYIKNHE